MHSLEPADANAVAVAQGSQLTEPEKPKESPLSCRIGAAEFTPGGFVDFTTVFRSTNTGNPIGTNFNAIPFSNTIGGHLTELRMTAQHSRLSLKMNTKYGENNITGYVEADFNGNDAANVFVTTKSPTHRQPLYWRDLKHAKSDVLRPQYRNFLTPNRVGISPD